MLLVYGKIPVLFDNNGENPSTEDDSISMWFVIKQNLNSARNEQHLGQCGTADEATPVKSDILCSHAQIWSDDS